MNFLSGLLLLLMPEENAFWTLLGLMDDYLEGYYSESMIEAQVDQLCFDALVRDNFPRLGEDPKPLLNNNDKKTPDNKRPPKKYPKPSSVIPDLIKAPQEAPFFASFSVAPS